MLASYYTSGAAALRAATDDPKQSSAKSTMLPLLTVTIPKTGGDGVNVLASVDETSLRVVKNRDGHFLVVSMTPSCKLRTFGMDVGMELLSVDNISCTTLRDEAAFFETLHSRSADKQAGQEKKKQTLGLTTLLAHPAPASIKQYTPPPGTYVTAVIDKEVQTTSVGLMVVQQQADGASNTKKGIVINNGTVTSSSSTNNNNAAAPTETSDYGKVMIQEIAPNALASGTLLRAGMQLISINNTLCVNKRESAQLLRSSTGRITLLAQVPTPVKAPTAYHVTATVEVPAAADNNDANKERGTLGLALSDTYKDCVNGIYITEVDPKGPFADSKLRVGMQLVRINNIECDDLEMAQALLSKAQLHQRLVTVLAKQSCQSVPPGTLLTVTAVKSDAQSKLGIMVGMDHNTMPVIQFIQEGGLMERSCQQGGVTLEPGMILHKVNNVPTKGLKTKEQVSQLLQKTTPQGTVTLLVEAPTTSLTGGTSATPPSTLESLKTITMIQRVPQQSIGWTLGLPRQQQGRVVVTDVEDGGLAMTAGVRKGMLLFKVDNTSLDCCYQSVAKADEVVAALIHERPVGVPVTLVVQEESPSLLVQPVMTGTIVKETKESLVGIRLRSHKGFVAIISIAEGSVSSATDLMGGMLIQSINNIDCSGKKPEDVAQLLADAEGAITMLAKTPDCPVSESTLASYVTTSVSKTARANDSARERCFTYEEGKVWVSEDGVKGVFRGSSLRIGMEVLSLNNIPCEILTPDGIKTLLEKSEDEYITILAARPTLPLGLLMTEVLRKKDVSDKFGVDCTATKGWRSKVVISKIKDGSLASTSKLLEGMEVVMVNNADCSRIDAKTAAEILAREAATGNVTYVAGVSSRNVPLNNRVFVTATLEMEQTGEDRPVGITVNRNHYGKNVITQIEEGSLASDTDLCEGMEILAINNQSCKYKKALVVQSLLSSSASSSMIILAERLPIPQGKVVIGSMVKTNVDMKVGVTMREVNGRVLIKYVVPDSLTSSTDLDVGMWIKAINNKDCTRSTSKDVADMLKAEVSVITILTETTTETFEEPAATTPETTDSAGETTEGTAGGGGAAAASDSGGETTEATGDSGEEDATTPASNSWEDTSPAASESDEDEDIKAESTESSF